MEIMNVDFFVGAEEPVVVGHAIAMAGFYATAGHPHGESVWIVVASVAALEGGGAAEFAAQDDEGFFEETARLEVGEEAGDGAIDFRGEAGMIIGEIFVLIPIRMSDLDEADTAFTEATSEETLSGEGGGVRIIEAVEFFGEGRFAVDVHGIWGLGLHAEGEFEGGDAGLEDGIGGRLGEVLAVDGVEEIELGALADGVVMGIVEILDGGLFYGHIASDGGALVDSGEEGAGPVADSAVAEGWVDREEAGEVLIFGTEPIRNPRAEAGADEGIGTGVEFEQGAPVSFVGAVDGFDDTEIVGAGPDEGKEVTDHGAAFGAGAEFPGRFSEVGGFGKLDAGFFEGQGFSVIADEGGFVVEGIDVGGTAVHEEKDDAFGAWSESGDLAGEWMGGFAGGGGSGLK